VHVQTVQLGSSPQCICWHPDVRIIAVGCDPKGLQPGSQLRCFDGKTLRCMQSFDLEPSEHTSSVCVVRFDSSNVPCLVVGTAFVRACEPEPTRGRLLVYQPTGLSAQEGGPFRLLAELAVIGAVYSLAPFKGMLLGSVTNRVSLWQVVPARGGTQGMQLKEVCGHYAANVIALHVQAKNEHILVGDLMRSICLLRYNSDTVAFEEVGREVHTAWLSAMQMLDDRGLCLCIDDACNVFILSQSCSTGAVDTGHGLQRVGQMHAGEFVNRLRSSAPASSSNSTDEDAGARRRRVIWASADGAFGVITSLHDESEFARCSLIQDAIEQEVRATMVLPHGTWRDVQEESTETGTSSSHSGFVDGDLMGRFATLPRDRQEAVISTLQPRDVHVNRGVEGLLRELHALSRFP